MADFIFKPTGDPAGVFANALEFEGLDPTETVPVADGTYDIYEKVVSSFTVSVAPTFTVENLGQEAVATADAGNITVTVASGVYTGTYTTDYLGATLTVAGVSASPACLVRPAVVGTTGDGDTLTVTPGLWLYEGTDKGDQTWVQKLDGVANGQTDLDYVIATADEGKVFEVAESYGGVTVTGLPVTIDFGTVETAMETDAGARFWYHPDDVVVNGSNQITAWNDHIAGASTLFDLSSANSTVAPPTWNAASNKAVFAAGQGIRSGTDFTTLIKPHVVDAAQTLVFMFVLGTKSGVQMNPAGYIYSMADSDGGTNSCSLGYTTAGQGASDANMEATMHCRGAAADAFGTNFSGLNTNTGNIALGKHLIEVHVTQTQARYYVDGVLQHTAIVTLANLPVSTVTRNALGGRMSGTAMQRASSFDLYEMYCTTNVANIAAIRAELMTRHGL